MFTPAISYSVALKYPSGVRYREFNRTVAKFVVGDDINVWIKNALTTPRPWIGWAAYNDQINRAADIKNNCAGHCKGVVVWNDRETRWLIHSVPAFPVEFDPPTGKLSRIDQGETVYGQSFVCLTMRGDNRAIPAIFKQIFAMHPNIYIASDAGVPFDRDRNRRTTHTTLIDLPLSAPARSRLCFCRRRDPVISHVAKHPSFDVDQFEAIAAAFNCRLQTQTWMRSPKLAPSAAVSHIMTILDETSGGDGYKTTQDHSKWAISATLEECVVYIGDMNRMESQRGRGGGGVVIRGDAALWRAFAAIVGEVERSV